MVDTVRYEHRALRTTKLLATLLIATMCCATHAAAEDPRILYVRKSCGSLANCFDGSQPLSAATTAAVGLAPSAEFPVIIDIGPGRFNEWASCGNWGHVTFRGAGRDHTTIGSALSVGMIFSGCDAIGVRDLSIVGSLWGVLWLGPGRSTWTNVDVTASGYAWYDACGGPEVSVGGVHHWFSSRLTSTASFGATTPVAAYLGLCGESWLYGVDVAVLASAGAQAPTMVGVDVNSLGDVRVFGSTIRVVVDDQYTSSTPEIVGVRVGRSNANGSNDPPGEGAFHMHGGIITTDAHLLSGADVVGIDATNLAFAHVVQTAFALLPGSGGSRTRLTNASIQSPFQWPSATSPPADLQTVDGADHFIETDCDHLGDCESAGAETHIMIYNASQCGALDPWYDVSLASCRGDAP